MDGDSWSWTHGRWMDDEVAPRHAPRPWPRRPWPRPWPGAATTTHERARNSLSGSAAGVGARRRACRGRVRDLLRSSLGFATRRGRSAGRCRWGGGRISNDYGLVVAIAPDGLGGYCINGDFDATATFGTTTLTSTCENTSRLLVRLTGLKREKASPQQCCLLTPQSAQSLETHQQVPTREEERLSDLTILGWDAPCRHRHW